ncbi:hypothetical protein PUNSTDRAFT_139251 [Punctularia strigosozonata HHB-11173 SS5]|uniref:Uncharacterized protein n=1 Tax=Punctularia strigosozonata (strain HHB-11173) TaxID=741275 RepID=R7S0I0_PUNST|nr:uncharacterized protein PUNSTDRAFT_139251 [Punctularia strigosozonata HHB-11173 SS5]EIN03718.1 hypothetical protein PUNSTDRAFT_139251 [Punctularia strigosozonata HHB-11173 SS5]
MLRILFHCSTRQRYEARAKDMTEYLNLVSRYPLLQLSYLDKGHGRLFWSAVNDIVHTTLSDADDPNSQSDMRLWRSAMGSFSDGLISALSLWIQLVADGRAAAAGIEIEWSTLIRFLAIHRKHAPEPMKQIAKHILEASQRGLLGDEVNPERHFLYRSVLWKEDWKSVQDVYDYFGCRPLTPDGGEGLVLAEPTHRFRKWIDRGLGGIGRDIERDFQHERDDSGTNLPCTSICPGRNPQ